jgi:hypothetical protein
MVQVKRDGHLVFGVHHQREGGNLRIGGTIERVGQ